MANKGESKQHKLLKEYGSLLLSKEFNVPKEHIYTEFSVGSIRFDVIAYPPVELNGEMIIGIECGNKKSNVFDNYKHFEKALKFVDLIIWLPYTIYRAPYSDLINSKIKEILFIQMSLDILDDDFLEVSNVYKENTMYALYITKEGRFPELNFTPRSTWNFE